MITPLKIKAIGKDNLETSGTGNLLQWRPTERFVRAIKIGGICWIVAAVGVFIPVLHFILAPTFLLAGLISLPVIYLKRERLDELVIPCPHCKSSLSFSGLTPRWPICLTCSECRSSFFVQDAALRPLISISEP